MKKIKIGILINSFKLKLYEYKILEYIIYDSRYELNLVVKKANPTNSTFTKYSKNLLYLIFKRFDRFLFKKKAKYLKITNVDELLRNVSLLNVQTQEIKYFDFFEQKDLDEIKGYDIDIFLRFGFNILKGEILKISKFGIWSFHHANNDVNRGGPAGFWEVINNEPTTGFILQSLTDDLDNGNIIEKGYISTHSISPYVNLNNISLKSYIALKRNLEKIYETRKLTYFQSNKIFYTNHLFKEPTNYLMFKSTYKIILNYLKYIKKKLIKKNRWFLLYSKNKSHKFETSLFRFKKLKNSKNVFWADPFVIDDINRSSLTHIFFEEYDYTSKRGHISHMLYDATNDSFSHPTVILKENFHLSYPCTFLIDKNYYMIPETHSDKTIRLYKAKEFPYKWTLKKILLEDITANDVTPFFHYNKWWIFMNVTLHEDASHHDDLFLYFTDDLLSGKWNSHPKNPIVSDSSNARMGGKVFKYNNEIYRPAQDCSGSIYGNQLNLNKIIKLSEFEYEEILIDKIDKSFDKNLKALHTFNFSDNITIIDGHY